MNSKDLNEIFGDSFFSLNRLLYNNATPPSWHVYEADGEMQSLSGKFFAEQAFNRQNWTGLDAEKTCRNSRGLLIIIKLAYSLPALLILLICCCCCYSLCIQKWRLLIRISKGSLDQLLSHENKTGYYFLGQRKFYMEEQCCKHVESWRVDLMSRF